MQNFSKRKGGEGKDKESDKQELTVSREGK